MGGRSERRGSAADWLVVGLGNPGREYEHTRHNVGADAVRLLAARSGQKLELEKGLRAEMAACTLPGGSVAVAVPTTYMNDSGLAVVALVRRCGIDAVSRLVVVHDELDLPTGRVKVKVGGGTAGHRGLGSIHAHLHDPGYVRVRIGIGKPPGRQPGAEYVLRRPGRSEQAVLAVAVDQAADAVATIVDAGVEVAMNQVNAAS
ncbi:MAG: aminoacyl-tRNA hydrolase [Actinomycetota bacterium]|nr:aminoacyl-tRNA hydrolase [Actinomycetota bacterium]